MRFQGEVPKPRHGTGPQRPAVLLETPGQAAEHLEDLLLTKGRRLTVHPGQRLPEALRGDIDSFHNTKKAARGS